MRQPVQEVRITGSRRNWIPFWVAKWVWLLGLHDVFPIDQIVWKKVNEVVYKREDNG